MKLINKLLHNEITKQLPTYLNIHRTYSNLPINIWIPTIEQYSNNFCIILNNSNKVNPLTDRDLLIFNITSNINMLTKDIIYDYIKRNTKISVFMLDSIANFIYNNIDNFYMYYTLKLKRTDILSNLNSY